MTSVRSQDAVKRTQSGYLMTLLGTVLSIGGVVLFVAMLRAHVRDATLLAGPLLLVVGVVVLCGLYMLQPNQSTVLTLFGRYVGTDRSNGLRWANRSIARAR